MHMRPTRTLARWLLAGVPTLSLALAFLPAGPANAATSSASASARAAAIARAFLRQVSVGQHAADHRVLGYARRIRGLTQVQSTNWSGYANDNSSGNTYSAVSASWTEPSASCTRQTSLAAFWVGIDGYSSGSVEQDGTLIECYHGKPYQYSWWEMYPTNAIQVVGSSVSAGDSISASVVRSGSNYTLSVTDSSNSANSFSTVQSCSGCANSSAEWIAEAPSGSRGIYPLADFNSWTASGASVTSGSTSGVISTFPDDEITMVDSSGLVKAQPGPLNGSGNGFTVRWVRSS